MRLCLLTHTPAPDENGIVTNSSGIKYIMSDFLTKFKKQLDEDRNYKFLLYGNLVESTAIGEYRHLAQDPEGKYCILFELYDNTYIDLIESKFGYGIIASGIVDKDTKITDIIKIDGFQLIQNNSDSLDELLYHKHNE